MHRYAITVVVATLLLTAAASAETRIEITRGNAVRTVEGLFGDSYRTITTPSGDTYLEPGSRMERLAIGGMRSGIFGARFSDPPPCDDGLPQRVLTGFRGFSCKPDRPQVPGAILTEVPRRR